MIKIIVINTFAVSVIVEKLLIFDRFRKYETRSIVR